MPRVSHVLCICTLHSRVSHVGLLTLWGLEYGIILCIISCINPLWTKLPYFLYVNILLPRVSRVLFIKPLWTRVSHVLTLCGLEYPVSNVLTLCGLHFHVYLILTY